MYIRSYAPSLCFRRRAGWSLFVQVLRKGAISWKIRFFIIVTAELFPGPTYTVGQTLLDTHGQRAANLEKIRSPACSVTSEHANTRRPNRRTYCVWCCVKSSLKKRPGENSVDALGRKQCGLRARGSMNL